MLQFTDTALDASLAPGQERTIRPVLQVDWNKTDTFTGTATTFSADNVIKITCDDNVDSGLPDEVIGRPTASSTTLVATLKGDLPDGTPLWKIFSPWYRDSPYRGLDLSGAAVKYSVWTATAGGSTETRRFTGWVSKVDVDRRTGIVTVTAANHLHLLGKPVTLPRWARITGSTPQLPHMNEWSIPNEDRMENAPLTFAWLWQYVMRQCNAMPGPSYRPNSVWFSSGYGGMIPEKASHSDYQAGRTFMSQGMVKYWFPSNWRDNDKDRSVDSWAELGFPSPLAIGTQGSTGDGTLFDMYSQAGATQQIKPGPAETRYLNGGVWARLPNIADTGGFVKLDVYLDSWQYVLGEYQPVTEPNMASVRLAVNHSNTTLLIRSSGAGAATRTLTVATPTTKDQAVYVSYEVDFSNPANSKIWYNNVLQTTTTAGTLATYPTVIGDFGYGADKSKCRVWSRGQAAWLNGEVWRENGANGANPRVPTWVNSSYSRKDFAIVNGDYPGALQIWADAIDSQNGPPGSGSMPCVTHIPLRREVDAWELLKEMCAAAHATMFIDAFGGLRIIPQAIHRKIETRFAETRKTINGDAMQGLSLHTDFDSVRDVIRYGGSPAKAVISLAYEASDAKQFQSPGYFTIFPAGVPGDHIWTTYRVSTPDDVISIEPGDVTQWAGDVSLNQYGIEGFHATNKTGFFPTPPAVLPVQVLVFDLGTQDYFDLSIDNADPNEMYLALGTASGQEVNTAALRIEGLKKIVGAAVATTLGTGSRLLALPVTDWHSAPWTFGKTVGAMLERTSELIPQADDLDVPGDPRRELYDLVTLKDPDGGVDTVIAQITGRSEEMSGDGGYRQRLSVRLVVTPGAWLLGIDGFTELGDSTYLI